MKNKQSKILSLMLILSLFIGMVGVVNVDTSYAASKKIHIKKAKVSLFVGQTYQQKLIDKKGKTIKATKVKWKSSNKKIATISKKGKIKAVKKGTVKMTAKYKGKTYKFTINVKKKTQKPKVYPKGYYINVEKGTYDISTGQVVTIKATNNDDCGSSGYTIHDPSNCIDVLDRTWTYTSKGETVENVKIKGLKPGTATIRFEVGEPMVTKEVVININPSNSRERLHMMVDKYGYVNGNGDKTYKCSVSSEQNVFFINHDNAVEMVSYYKTDSITSLTSMYLYLSNGNITNPNVKIGSYDLNTTLIIDSYTKEKSLTFSQESGDKPVDQVQKLTNSVFKLAMAAWDYALKLEFNMDLNEMGFISY